MTTPSRLLSVDREREALRALSEAATPGEWWAERGGWVQPEGLDEPVAKALGQPGAQKDADAAFIVAAVNYVRAALSSPETTPAGVLALDTERLRKAIDLSGIGIAEGGHAASEWADAVAREYNRLGGAPKEDWQCETVGCYLHVGHASEHEPGMCECGADMEAHSGGWTLLHHDQFMEGFLAAALGRSGSGGGRG